MSTVERSILTLCGCALVAIGAPAADPPDPVPADLGAKVAKFAKDNLGKKVDDGECASLVVKALESAGAKTTLDYGVTGADDDYKWGEAVEKYKDVRPGDVIQFRDVKIVVKKVVEVPGGGTQISTQTQVMSRHTAVVSKNSGDGKFSVLEQNTGPQGADEKARKVVQENVIDLGAKTEGKVWIYRPVLK